MFTGGSESGFIDIPVPQRHVAAAVVQKSSAEGPSVIRESPSEVSQELPVEGPVVIRESPSGVSQESTSDVSQESPVEALVAQRGHEVCAS